MPSFFKDLRRKSSLFTRKDPPPATIAIQPENAFPARQHPLPPVPYENGGPSPDTVTPPPSDAESDSGPSVTSGAHGGSSDDSSTARRRAQTSGPPSVGNRLSIMSTAASSTPKLSIDPLAPRVMNFADGAHCTQKLLLLSGQIGERGDRLLQGTVTVSYPNHNTFPSQTWPVVHSRFKVLVMLQAGANKIRLDFQKKTSQSSLHTLNASRGVHTSYLTVVNVPNTHVPPLHLVLLVARDSPETYDALPGEVQREGNGIPTAIRKFRMAGLLWQAFTAEQMRRHGFGMRTFRFEEEWQPGTVAAYDDSFTNEVKVHVIRLKETVADIQNLDYAQQYDKATQKGKLYDIAGNACRDYFRPPPGCPQHIAAMFLDTHWDPSSGVIRGHAALGGANGDIHLGIFGSHALHTWPSHLGSVLSAFNDFTPTDTKYVANDVGRCGSNWESCCVGMAAFLHETGHALGLPHEVSGIMAADYGRFNRTFCVWEGFRSETGERGQAILEEEQESAFHELSALRLSTHPCLRKPGERPLQEDSVQVFPVDEFAWVTATAGIAWIEYYDGDNEPCRHHENFLKRPSTSQLRISKNVRAELPQFLQQAKRLRIKIYSKARGEATIQDFDQLFADSLLKVGSKKIKAFRGLKVGFGQLQGSQPQEVLFHSFFDRRKMLNTITVYHGDALDGLEFHYEDFTSQLFGKRGGRPGGSTFELNTRIGEQLHGFVLRAGFWIDGLQIITTHSRKSPFFGNPKGGSLQLMTPPLGYSIIGVAGSCGAWLDSFQIICSR